MEIAICLSRPGMHFPEKLGYTLSAGPIRSFLINFRDSPLHDTYFFSNGGFIGISLVKVPLRNHSRLCITLLYIFDPNIIAHSQLVTTDIYAAGTTTPRILLFMEICT